jgi:hypothetical protein
MKNYILENGKKVELTEEKIARILDDTERRIEKGRYHIVYDSAKDAERTTDLLSGEQRVFSK